MDKHLFDQVVYQLLPEMNDEANRKALVVQALMGSPILDKIEWTGSASPFTVLLVQKLEIFGDISPRHPALIALLQQVQTSVGDDRKAEIDALIKQLASALEQDPIHLPLASTPTPINPYKGLQAFTSADKDYFFGREDFIHQLLAHLEKSHAGHTPRLLAVIGASGSGKSSIVMAGLLPLLRQGILPQSEKWHILERLVPGEHPLEALTDKLVQADAGRLADVEAYLSQPSTRGLHRVVDGLEASRVVLFVDQFEEVFTQTTSEDERRQFLELLTTAVKEPNGKLIVLLTLRADFYDRPLNYAEFGTLLAKCGSVIVPMSRQDLYNVVQKPALVTGLRFEEGLVSEIVLDVRDQIGALPLLQFTLDELYNQREGNQLTRRAYHDMGGVQGALKGHADAIYEALPTDEHRRLARALFLRLTEPGTTQSDALRRRASLSELMLSDTESTSINRDVVDRFVRTRLLTTDRVGKVETVEVSHEALIREWPRLIEWLHDARESMRLHKALRADVTEWLQRGQPDDMLYRGTVLQDSYRWIQNNVASAEEQSFVIRGIVAQVKQQTEDIRIAKQVNQLKRAQFNRNIAILGLVILVVTFYEVGNRATIANYIAAKFGEALLRVSQDNTAEATRLMDSLIQTYPQQSTAYLDAGIVFSAIGDTTRAIVNYSKAIELDSNSSTAYGNRGIAYSVIGDYQQAIRDYSKNIELDPSYIGAYINRGNSYQMLENYEQATADYSKAIELDPSRANTYINRGNSYQTLENYEQAIADYSKAIELDPSSVSAYINRGNSYQRLKNYEQAIADFSKAIELDPSSVAAYTSRGGVHLTTSNYEQAIADYSKVIELDPSSASYANRGSAYRGLKNYEQAIADFSKAIELDPTLVYAHATRGFINHHIGNIEQAIADFSRAIELDTNYASAYLGRGRLYFGIDRIQEAVADYRKYEILTGHLEPFMEDEIAESQKRR
jgi:tetratricopeptide (TPR) repeat protein